MIATSTGGTVAAVAAHDQGLMRDVKGIAFISPNFGLKAAGAPLLTLPGARYWVPLVAGRGPRGGRKTPQRSGSGAAWGFGGAGSLRGSQSQPATKRLRKARKSRVLTSPSPLRSGSPISVGPVKSLRY